MKQADIKRLEKAVELYKKIEVVLDKACDSIDNQPREYFYRGEQTTYHLENRRVKQMQVNRDQVFAYVSRRGEEEVIIL